jgi:hypothetical protein
MSYLIPCEVVEFLLHCHHLVWISKCILYHVSLNKRHKRVMFTKMSNSRSSGYPLLNVTKYVIDGVILLKCLVDYWVRCPPFLDQLHLPLDRCLLLEVAHCLDLDPLLLEPVPHLELVEMLVWKMMVDLVLVKALRVLVDTHIQWTCSLA